MSKALYLDDTYQFECEAVVQGVNQVEGTGEYEVILDQTVFYPHGGGQPSDKGHMASATTVFNVEKVSKRRETADIIHRGTFTEQPFTTDAPVKCKIDAGLRMLHSRYHLAGHLIRMAFIDLQVYDKWQPHLGNHSPTGAYVEFTQFDPTTTPEQVKSLMEQLEATCRELIKKDYKSVCIQVSPEDIPDDCQWMLKDGMKSMEKVRINRVENLDKYWMPCGGTLCSRLGELGAMSITKYSFKKGLLRICYALAA